MIVNFNEDYLRDLYRSGKSDKKHRFQPQIVRKYIRVIDLMISEDNVQGLWKYNSLNYERLEGNKEGLSSVRVNDQYRIEFEEEFCKKNGSCICKEILGYDLSKTEEMKKIQEEKLLEKKCPKVVLSTCEILEKMI